MRYWAAGEWFEVVDLEKFLKQFPTQSQAHAEEDADEGGSGSSMMQMPPTTRGGARATVSARARPPMAPPGYGIPSGPSPTVPVPPETPPPIPIPVSEVSPMEMPEIILFARELDLEPKIVKKFGKPGVLGMFSYKNGIGEVRIHADLFKPGNEVPLAAALGHELGHATDWMPSKTDLKRGNILGRLYSLRKYLSGQFTTPRGVDISNAVIRAELLELTREWNPWDEANASDSYNKYRHSSEELYAEGLSAIITNPAYAQRVAPTFFREFFAAMDTKPEVKEAYFGMQQMLSGNRKALVENRLQRDREMSELGDLTALEWQQRLQDERQEAKRVKAIDLKIETLDRNHWVVDLARQVEAKGKRIPETRDPRYALEERNYLGGKILGWLKRNIHPVWREVLDAGIDWIDFGNAAFYERVLEGDRAAKANPNASSPAVTREKYDLLKSMLTPRQRNVLARTLDAWRAAYRDVAEAAYQSGLITDQTWQEMLDNPAYGTFWVIEHMANQISSHIIQQIGTTKPIANVADATLLKALAFIRATEYNNVKRSVFNFLDAHFPNEIEQAREIWYTDKDGVRRSEPQPPNGEDRQRWKGVHQGELSLVYYMEDGRLRGKYVDPYIAVALAQEPIGKFQILVKIFRRMNSGFFRPVYTTMNLGFQTANAARDFFRFWKAMPKVSLGRAVKLYWQAIPIAKVRAFGLKEKPTQEALDAYEDLAQAEEAGILSMPFKDYFAGREIEDTLIEDILARSGVGEFTPRAYTPGNKLTKLLHPITKEAIAAQEALGVKALLRWIEDTGTFIETLPKAAALIEFKGQGQVSDLTPAQRSHIRRNVGSPDFLMGGTSKGVFNEVFLFSNAMIQGFRADTALATAPATRSGWWLRTITIGILPKMLAAAGQLGWRFGGDDDDDQWVNDRLQYPEDQRIRPHELQQPRARPRRRGQRDLLARAAGRQQPLGRRDVLESVSIPAEQGGGR